MQKGYVNLQIIGMVIVGIALGLFLVTFSLTKTVLKYGEELHKQCPLPIEVCPFKSRALPIESVISFILAIGLGGIGLYLLLLAKRMGIKPKEKIEFKQTAKTLQGEERKIYELIAESGGSIFQNDLVTKTGFSKVKVSRILDRLETKGLVERRRRGMANLIFLRK